MLRSEIRTGELQMSPQITALLENIQLLEDELEGELAKRRAELRVGMEHGRVVFEAELLRRHRELQVKLSRYVFGARPLVLITTPVIYSLIVPVVLLDLFVTVYQAICFPVYGIAKVRRGDYFVFDRAHLAYLNAVEKLNCAFCTYANGVVAYVREVASRTEEYWCPIKHAKRIIGAHRRYSAFEDFGDAEAYAHRLTTHRAGLRGDADGGAAPGHNDHHTGV
jgi:hypothetical protein